MTYFRSFPLRLDAPILGHAHEKRIQRALAHFHTSLVELLHDRKSVAPAVSGEQLEHAEFKKAFSELTFPLLVPQLRPLHTSFLSHVA